MVQLEIEGVFVDLYEQDPIKLNFNIEDVVDVEIQSEYSRQFRVPATDHNYSLFQTLFDVEGYDFDVTQKRESSILVNGAEFRRGEVRLLNIYRSDAENKVDYELVFLGSSKSLSSQIGNGSMADLDFSAYIHDVTRDNVIASWQAYPEGSITAGLFEGDVLWPIVDFGNSYSGTGIVQETRIALGDGTGRHINNDQWPLNLGRLRPMMRVRALIDMIFEQAGDYTFESNFMDSNEFRQMYLTAWGNEAVVNFNLNNENLAKWGTGQTNVLFYYSQIANPQLHDVIFNNVNFDNSSNLELTSSGNYIYRPPANGTYVYTSNLNIEITRVPLPILNVIPETRIYPIFNFDGATIPNIYYAFNPIGPSNTTVLVEKYVNGSVVFSETIPAYPASTSPLDTRKVFTYSINEEYNFVVTNPLASFISSPRMELDNTQPPDFVTVIDSSNEITQAQGVFTPANSFDNEYKQLDFLKDIFKMFRLVMVPDRDNPKNFIIEPWEFFIGSGDVKDWTSKLDLSKDKVIKPIVLEQKDRVTFSMNEDKDWLNALNLDEFKEPFGTQIVNSGYDILDGEKEFKVKIAPSPFTQIQGYTLSTDWLETFILQICTQDATENGIEFRPIKAKPRILYYNGFDGMPPNQFTEWFFEDEDSVVHSQYGMPQVSYYSQLPPNPNAKILNFQKENGYDRENVINDNYGQDLYSRYWSNYINLIYDKYSRRLTAYFTLDQTDLLGFKYNDVIYVEGVYYYVERIYNAPLDGKNTVKVDLIKLINYQPNIGNFIPPIELNIWNEFNELWNTTTAGWDD